MMHTGRQITPFAACLQRLCLGECKMDKEERQLVEKIHEILKHGNDVEIRKNKDGSVKIFEVQKRICKA